MKTDRRQASGVGAFGVVDSAWRGRLAAVLQEVVEPAQLAQRIVQTRRTLAIAVSLTWIENEPDRHVSQSTDGTELFYISGEGELKAVAVETENDTFKMGTTTTLFQTAFEPGKSVGVVPDSQEFYLNEVSVDLETPITLIINWDQGGK